MTRIENILRNARRTLADPNKQRWSDENLISILSEAQEDFNQNTEFLNTRIDIKIVNGEAYFKLPDHCWKLTRVLYNNCALPMVTHRELDDMTMPGRYVNFGIPNVGPCWEESTGLPQAIIYDRREFNQGKIYPIPEGLPTTNGLVDPYGVVSEVAEPEEGVADSFEYGFEFIPGEIANGFNYTEEPYGVTADIPLPEGFLRCYYLRTPKELEDINSELETPRMYDIALKFYVCGQAFMDDIDTGYQQKGAAQMMMYERYLEQAKKQAAQDFIRAGAFQTTYRRGF